MNSSVNNYNRRVTDDFDAMIKITIFNSLGFFFLDFLIPYVASQELRAAGIDMGVIFSIIVVGYIISSPFVGAMTDRISKKLLVFIGSVGRGVAYFFLYIAIIMKSLIGLAIGMFLLGFLAGFFWIPLDTLIAEKSSAAHRSYAYGRHYSAEGIGTFFGAFIGFGILLIAIEITPTNSFLIYSALVVFGLVNILAGIVFFLFVDESIKYENVEDEFISKDVILTLKAISKGLIVGLALLFIVLFLSSTNGSLAKPFLNVYLLENIENNPTLAALAYAPSGFVSMLLAPRLGEIADRTNPYIGISLASVLGAIITFSLINTSVLWMFAFLLILDVTVVTTGWLILTNLISRVSKSHRGKIFGLQSTFTNFGAIIGPILGGIVWDLFGSKSPFILSIMVELALIPFFIIAIFYLKPHLAESLKVKENAKQNNRPQV
ncbi:MAG: MFS transporter [Candidatus Hodarchaeota archaeon]